MPQECKPEFLAPRVVHSEDLNCGSAYGRDSFHDRTVQNEVLTPTMGARMKERHYLSRHGIDPREIRTFAEIATMTCQSEIFGLMAASMLFRDYVLDVVCKGGVLLP